MRDIPHEQVIVASEQLAAELASEREAVRVLAEAYSHFTRWAPYEPRGWQPLHVAVLDNAIAAAALEKARRA